MEAAQGRRALFLSIQAQDFIEEDSADAINDLGKFLSIQAQDFIEDAWPSRCAGTGSHS